MDYTSGPYTVTFPAGVTMIAFDVPITDDKISESVENFMLTINQTSLLTKSDVGTPVEIVVTIVDDERKYNTRVGNWNLAFKLVTCLPLSFFNY